MTRSYCIDIDNSTFRLTDNSLETFEDFHSVRDSTFLVADFEKSISRVMNVESDIKYAEAMVIRNLQEEGEFDEPVSVITHWKQKRGRSNTEIFFTAIPTRMYLQYTDSISESDDLLILIPIFSVLANLIDQIDDTGPVAVVFRHGRFADIVIGKKNYFYYATRCVSFDTSEEQINSLWDTVAREISIAVQTSSIQIDTLISLNWINALEKPPELTGIEVEHLKFNETTVMHDNQPCNISFPCALDIFPPHQGIAPKNGKLLFYLNKLSPLIVFFFLFAIATNIGMAVYFNSSAKLMETSIKSYDKRIGTLKNQIPSMPEKEDYMAALQFTDSLFHNRLLPSYKDIINNISAGTGPATTIVQLQVDYSQNSVRTDIYGDIKAEFNTAYKEYQNLMTSLQKDGYTIDNNRFITRINSSAFRLSLMWSVQ